MGLEPSYRRAPDAASSASDLRNAALQCRRDHPTWGAELIHIHLRKSVWSEPVPSTRTLQRWLLRGGLAPAPTGRPRKDKPIRATMPHDTWQMDAKELIKIGTGELVS